MSVSDEKIRRSTRSGIEVFVGAANGKIDISRIQVHGYRAKCVSQIPDNQRTRPMSLFGYSFHVANQSGAVTDLGKSYHSSGWADQFDYRIITFLSLNEFMLWIKMGDSALNDMKIRWEVIAFRYNLISTGTQFQSSRQGLKQINRR